MNAQAYFDGRSATYDQSEVHRRSASLLIAGVELKPGFSVLDIATGTGLVALEAAQCVGPAGRVIGIDLSKGMLAEAHRKAVQAELRNIEFVEADAEQLTFPNDRFDCIFCSSAIVFMADILRALRHWFEFLKPLGMLAFDAPANPFGVSQTIAEIASGHGVQLAYGNVADTPAKCRSLVEGAHFETVNIRTELVNASPLELAKAIAFWDERIDHPAWQALHQLPHTAREAMRAEYVTRVTAAAVDGYVPNDTALNFVFARKPA